MSQRPAFEKEQVHTNKERIYDALGDTALNQKKLKQKSRKSIKITQEDSPPLIQNNQSHKKLKSSLKQTRSSPIS